VLICFGFTRRIAAFVRSRAAEAGASAVRPAAKGLSRLGESEACGMGFLEGDQSACELEECEVVLVLLRPADQDGAVAVEP
jgi:hypothetical protein